MTESNRMLLTFDSDTGKVVSLSIPRADMNKTAATATTSMQGIIDTGIVVASGSRPTSIMGAELISTQRTNIVPSA